MDPLAQAIPYCGVAPEPAGLWLRWNGDPLAWAVLAFIGGLFFLARRRAAAPDARLFWIGWAALALALVSPLCALSSALFSARAAHHLVLLLAVAPLLALSGVRMRKAPLALSAAVQAAVLWAWHAPFAYAAALSNDAVYWLMQLSLLASALWFWSAVIARRDDLGAPAALAATMAQMGLLAALITFAPTPLYAPHLTTTAAWGLTALQDQQLAGLMMWTLGALPYLIATLALSARLLRSEPAPQ